MGVKELNKLVSTERKMLRMMWGVVLRDRGVTSTKVVERMGVKPIGTVVKEAGMRGRE